MSRIIKAAELKVLVPNESQTVIPAMPVEGLETPLPTKGGTILDAANLLEDAQRKAEEMVAEAEAKGRGLVEQAQAEVEALRLKAKETGFAEGYAEGLAEGRSQALEQAGNLLSLLESIVEEGLAARTNNLQALEDDFLKLSLLLADKLVRRTVERDVSWLEPVVKEAVQALGAAEEIVVVLNPVDYSLLQEQGEDLPLPTRASLRFEQDPAITQGGCLIESENGLIDARLEQRLGKLAQHLLEVLYHEDS